VTRLFILGAGGHGAVVAEAAILSKKWVSVELLDDNADPGIPVVGCSVIGKISNWSDFVGRNCEFFVAIGNNEQRDELLSSIEKRGGALATITHPSAVISPSANVEPGVVVCAGAVVNPRARVGRGTIVNTAASVDHDCALGNATHVSPGAHLAGRVTVGARTWIGIGAVVSEGVTIGSDSVVGAGAAVVSDVDSSQTVVGVPASPMRKA